MKQSKFTDSQIIEALKRVDGDESIANVRGFLGVLRRRVEWTHSQSVKVSRDPTLIFKSEMMRLKWFEML